MPSPSEPARQRIDVRGIVQGVGFRPFVYALAGRWGLAGNVRNHSLGVTIEVEGPPAAVANFVAGLQSDLPPLARIDCLQTTTLAATGARGFDIVASQIVANASTPISPDMATCDQCLAELRDSADRRYRYPFINCTNCGPRYTIIRDIPYDRPLTTMARFVMCAACHREYNDPANRRYHAQPNACPACGPTIWFVDAAAANEQSALEPTSCRGELALAAFHRAIAAGLVVAIKGIGGSHLACAAGSETAIARLRERKGRVDKPLAIMVDTLAAAQRLAYVGDDEQQILCGRERPIVLLRRRPDCPLPATIAPGSEYLGIMLPYSPLHALLVEHQPLVMTSGNLSEEPIVRTNVEAFARLSGLADAYLLHNRDIQVVCDDSVVRVVGGRELPLRRSRGYAPLPVRMPREVASVLAVGGELKAAFCMTRGDYALLSPHIGDMGNLETLAAFARAVAHFATLFRVAPLAVACDLHPGYLSTGWAREHARECGVRLVKVQHHHAHIAAALVEHGRIDDQPVIGVSFDGTGYGSDGAIWGGEVLLASCHAFQRWAHLKYVPLPGGDAAIKHPYRAALAHLWAAGIAWDERLACVATRSANERNVLRRQLENDVNCVATSSMGRLFDAAAALVGIRQSVSYEAQAALEMEALANRQWRGDAYPFHIVGTSPRVVDVAPLLAALVDDVVAQAPVADTLARFHATIAQMIVELCAHARDETGFDTIVLSGGVFQNKLLIELATQRLEALGFCVLTHRIVPPNDGGLALGRAIVAANSLLVSNTA